MVDDEVRHHFEPLAQCGEVAPRTEPRVDLSVIDGIETRVGSIDWIEKRQQMNSAEQSRQWTVEELAELRETATRESIDITYQLGLRLHLEKVDGMGIAG